MPSSRYVTVTVRVNKKAIRRVVAQFKAFADLMAKFGRSFDEALAAWMDRRVLHGRGNFRADGTWASDMCSAWLHESCELPGQCCCRCHRRKEPRDGQ